MTPEEAINVLARHAIASAAESVSEFWENYPEVGEDDWEKVAVEASAMAAYPAASEYREAYALLEARAKATEEE